MTEPGPEQNIPEQFNDFFTKVKETHRQQRLAYHTQQYEKLKTEGRLDEIPLIWTDVEERHIYDNQTGIFTQVGLLQRLEINEFPKIKAGEIHSYFIIFGDVDGLKQINDTHGHDAGNSAIEKVAVSMRGNIRGGDLVGRWTRGDEFVMFLPDSEEEEVKAIIKNINNKMQQERVDEIGISISMGYAKGMSQDDFLQTVKEADRLMYIEKENRKKVNTSVVEK